MQSALMLVTAATLGWGGAAELRRIEPNDLLAAAFVAGISARLDAKLTFESASPEAVALELWYPPVPAAGVLGVAGPAPADPLRDTRYDLRLPWFRSKP
jgi:hypothetical protein